jgi:hypothetical protein
MGISAGGGSMKGEMASSDFIDRTGDAREYIDGSTY